MSSHRLGKCSAFSGVILIKNGSEFVTVSHWLISTHIHTFSLTPAKHKWTIFRRLFVQELIRRWDSERQLFVRRYPTRTSKYSPLLNIHTTQAAGRLVGGATSGRGRVVLLSLLHHASATPPIYCNEVRFWSHSDRISPNNRGVTQFNALAGGDPLRMWP